jgi:hypothetical protein
MATNNLEKNLVRYFITEELKVFFLFCRKFAKSCQGAEIIAAMHKRGREEYSGVGKIRVRIFAIFIKKGPKRRRIYFVA